MIQFAHPLRATIDKYGKNCMLNSTGISCTMQATAHSEASNAASTDESHAARS